MWFGVGSVTIHIDGSAELMVRRLQNMVRSGMTLAVVLLLDRVHLLIFLEENSSI